MSNVTAIDSRQGLKLDKLEFEVARLWNKQETARAAVGVKLLEIFESSEWKPGGSWSAYLEGFSDRLLEQGITFDQRDMHAWYLAAAFDQRIAGQSLRKPEREALAKASPTAKMYFAKLVRSEMKDSPVPINEATAIKQLWDAGYFHSDDPKPITSHKVQAVTRGRQRDDKPQVLASDLTARLNAAIEIIDGYTDLGDAIHDPDLRHAARTLTRLLRRHFNL